MSVNIVFLVGNLGADVEMRTLDSGNCVADLRVATSHGVKRNEEWTEETEWHRVTVWGKQAESCAKYLTKGSKVHIEGRIKTEKYQDKEGKDRWATKVIARKVTFMDAKGASGGGNPGGGNQQRGNSGGGGGGGGGGHGAWSNAGPDDDIPF